MNRDTLHIAVFGTLWGLLEITLGTALKSFRIPFTGVIMVVLVTLIIVAGRRFAPRRGSVLLMGVLAALLKVFSIGGIVLAPVGAIVVEALLAEAVLTGLGYSRVSAAVVGVLLLVYTPFHPLIAHSILYGSEIVPIYLEMVTRVGGALGVGPGGLALALAVWAAAVAALGTAAGLAGHRLGADVDARAQGLRAERRAA